MQRQSRWVGACGADACMHVAGAAPAALDSRMPLLQASEGTTLRVVT